MHIRLSWHYVALVCLLLVARPSGASAGIPERLKWVRGTVVSVTSTSVSTQLRDTTLTLAIDDATEVMLVGSGGMVRAAKALPATAYLQPGDTVEVHYRDSDAARTVRYLWIGITLGETLISRRSGTSAAGVIADITPGRWWSSLRMTVASSTDRRRFIVPPRADVMDAQGGVARAKPLLLSSPQAPGPGDRVVIVYRRHKSRLTAQVIRLIPPAPRSLGTR
jgi:hypothetical protein